MKTLIILLLTAATAMAAHPTGTVTRAVTVTTNGVLWGSDTNFAGLNGIATTAQVAAAVSSNTAVSARVTAIETNHATAAQGALADTALQSADLAPSLKLGIVWNTDTIYVSGAGSPQLNGTYVYNLSSNAWYSSNGKIYWFDYPASSVMYMECLTNEYYMYRSDDGTPVPGNWYTYGPSTEYPSPTVTYQPVSTNTAQDIVTKIGAAIWHTNQFLNLDGSTNTLIYLGAP